MTDLNNQHCIVQADKHLYYYQLDHHIYNIRKITDTKQRTDIEKYSSVNRAATNYQQKRYGLTLFKKGLEKQK
jgi:hypothetical protein